MSRTFAEIFRKYTPTSQEEKWLPFIEGDIEVQADKEKRYIRAYLPFSRHISIPALDDLAEHVRAAYDLNSVFFHPKFPKTLWGTSVLPDVLTELNRRGVVARGFFDHCTTDLTETCLTLSIPFSENGVEMIYDAKTPDVLKEIIKEMYDTDIAVEIHQSGDVWDVNEAEYQHQIELMQAQLKAEEKRAAQAQSKAEKADAPKLPWKASIYEGDPTPVREGDIITIGQLQFDVSAPEYIYGDPFDIEPTAIAQIQHPQKNIVLIGELFSFVKEDNNTGDAADVSLELFDGNSSIGHKDFGIEMASAKEMKELFVPGNYYAIRGTVRKLKKRNIEDTDWTFTYTDVAKISAVKRKDKAEEKRVELHLHTTMSTMDALIDPAQAVKTAYKWGHPAVAITDHGNVQAFPEAMIAYEKAVPEDADFKVIYGMEAYFVNNMASALVGKPNPDFSSPCVVFDIETTGLSVQNCKITEIGAVKIADGQVLESFDTFVNPECPIPPEIVELTHITDEMVADAPSVKDALTAFFSFIGDDPNTLLIAHNANFDVGFIRYFAKESGLPFAYPYLDTLAVSRFLNTDLHKHNLDVLAKHYDLGDFNHHRACDDAEMLALIWMKMIDQLKESEMHTFDEMQREMAERTDPLKLKPFHQILLVKNQTGLKNLYQLISKSYLQYFYKKPLIPKTELEKFREGLIIGSACEAGELFRAILENRPEAEIEEIVNYYDYLEIQPICNNRFLIAEGTVKDDEGLRDLNRRIVALGEQYNKPVVATCDAHFMDKCDELYRKILLAGQKYKDADRDVGIYFRTTDEMLEEFSYLGEEKAYEVVVTNTRKIADMVEKIRPIPKGKYTPEMEGADDELQEKCWTRARELYGDPLPELVSARLERELSSIIKNGFSVLYLIAQRLVAKSESLGYQVGSRGSVGSSFVANMAGISEVNPLPPHYYCPNCKHSEFFEDGSVGSGFDLPDKICPLCGTKYKADGQNIMFETFLGFYGDKDPDIDLNFSGDVQGKIHKYTEELFGKGHVFRAGTLGTLADKTAYGYVAKYVDSKGFSLPRAEMDRLVSRCLGVKKLTGQHPGGIIVVPQKYDVYDFTPVQHPADDPNSDIITTHFAFTYLHETILKLDELGHDIPTKYKWLEKFTDTSVLDVAMNDPSVYELLESTKPLGVTPDDIGCSIGTYGLPELGTSFVQKTLLDAQPHTFADLLKISGLTHGTNVWLGNAQDLIKDGTCDIKGVIGCRDDIMIDLISYGVDKALAFKTMEGVRKGKGLTPEQEQAMKDAHVPDWYIASCKKIKYLFPKAHAAAYVMSAIRLAWYKVHKPVAFYSTMFTVAPGAFDATVVMGGQGAVKKAMKDITDLGRDATAKDKENMSVFQLVNEAMARGIEFLPIDLEKSHSYIFQPEGNGIRMPFTALPGLGSVVAENILKAREEEPFFSVEDLKMRGKVGASMIDLLRANHVLDNIDETDQVTMRF